MNRIYFSIVFTILNFFVHTSVQAQARYSSKNIFSHNDYEQAKPFYAAYRQNVGYIEVDVYLKNQELLVAHHEKEIVPGKTIETMYLDPLQHEVTTHKKRIYPKRSQHLGLSVDLKTEGMSTLKQLVRILEQYPDLLKAKGLTILISGNVPDPTQWGLFPDFIQFDGRPDIVYTPEQLKRIGMVSNDFKKYSQWDGQGHIPYQDDEKIKALLTKIHSVGKKFRFWANPDKPAVWEYLLSVNVDIIGTDTPSELIEYLESKKK